MQIPFKLSNTGGNEAMVADSNFKEHYSAINENLAWKTLRPSIRKAVQDSIIPAIGEGIYNALMTVYHGATPATNAQATLIEAIQDATAYYAILQAAPELNVSVADMGIVEKGSSGAPTMAVTQWRYREFKYEITKKADKYLDNVIRLLEELSKVDETEFFTPWIDSPQYDDTRTVFFQNAREFDKYVLINGSRRLFSQISKDILSVEEEIDHLICIEQFNALATAIKDGPPSTAEKALIEKIRCYVAPKAMAKAAAGLILNLDYTGLSISSYTDGSGAQSQFSSTFKGAEAVGAHILKLQRDAELNLKVLRNFIYSKIDDYPLIEESDCYTRYSRAKTGPIYTGPGGIMI